MTTHDVGRIVRCTTCERTKKPIGRSAPMECAAYMCDEDCPGYRDEPFPSDLWPREARLEAFGE